MMRTALIAIMAVLSVGCNNAGDTTTLPEPAVANAVTVATATPQRAGSITTGTKEPSGEIVTRPSNPQLKPGCNYNTSCKANCEWCSGNTCTCRLKGIP
jgi:hypothetical protein